MKNLIWKHAIVILFFILLVESSYSSEQRIFTIGVQDFKEYLPYSKVEDNKYCGFNREILDLFAKSKGYTFVYKPRSIKRLYHEYLRGKYDLKYPDNPYWSANLKKEKSIAYSDPVVEYFDGVLVVPMNEGKGVKNLKKLGIVIGFTPFAYMKWIKAGTIKVYENPSYEGLLRQTIIKRVDGAYSNIAVSQYYLEKRIKDPNALVFDRDLPHTKSYRHLSSFKYPEIINEFNNFLKKQHNAIEKLKKEYRVEEGIKAY